MQGSELPPPNFLTAARQVIDNQKLSNAQRHLRHTEYHNIEKTHQNQRIQDALVEHLTDEQLRTGFAASLDGANGGTSDTYVRTGFPAANVVAVSNSSDSTALYRSIQPGSPLEGLNVLPCQLASLIAALQGPCMRSCYFDYTGTWNGKKSGPKPFRYSPKNDVREFFTQRLAMPDGCLIFITIGKPPFVTNVAHRNDVDQAQKDVVQFAANGGYSAAALWSEYYTSNRLPMCMLAFFVAARPNPNVGAPQARRCGAPTRKGSPCRNRVKHLGDTCYLH